MVTGMATARVTVTVTETAMDLTMAMGIITAENTDMAENTARTTGPTMILSMMI